MMKDGKVIFLDMVKIPQQISIKYLTKDEQDDFLEEQDKILYNKTKAFYFE